MGRVIFAEKSIEKQIENIYKENVWSIGVLIGQVSKG